MYCKVDELQNLYEATSGTLGAIFSILALVNWISNHFSGNFLFFKKSKPF